MSDLTEQLYAGTLPTGHYYFNNGVETYIVLYSNANTKDRKMQEPSGLMVISEVPNYEEWQATEKYNKHLEEIIKIYERKDKQATETSIAYNKLAKENDKLKELLKECREFFYENLIDTEFHFSCGLGSNIKKQSCIRSLSNLKTKINQALGEDK